MWIMLVCGFLLLVGLTAGVAWSSRPFSPPDQGTELTATEVARRCVWYWAIAVAAGAAAGVTVIGAGGRMAMRLLAVTAGDGAQGRITEADQVVGRITVDGTRDFVVFNGVFGGALCGALFLLVRRFLPAGRLGGVAYGLGLLLVLGSVTDPLRKENPDFDLVGPGWVAVLVFTVLAIGFGATMQGFTARASTWFSQLSTKPRVLVRYAVPAIPFVLAAPAAAVSFGVVLVTRWRPVVNAVRSRRWTTGGRVLLIVLVLLSLPNFISNVVDIVGR